MRASWLRGTESQPARPAQLHLVPAAKTDEAAEPDSPAALPVVADRHQTKLDQTRPDQTRLAQTRPERRAQTRSEVDTSATIFFIKTRSTLSGRIADLSLGGCRIRCDDPFPVGIYTRVETEFCLEGLPFRLGGVVQAIHDRYTVGIRFLDMSSRKREQVEQLMAEMAEGRDQGA